MTLFSTTKLPGYHVCLGLVFFGLGTVAKDGLPQAIGSLPIIQFPCAFLSAVLIPFGSLLALRALILQTTGSRRNLLSYHLLGLVFVLVMLSLYFGGDVVMNHVFDLTQSPSVLPKLVENARSFPDEQKRMLQAKWAYRIYGVIIAYRLDNQQAVYYEPNADDLTARLASERSNRQAFAQITFIKKVTAQFPYLFGLYAATFTTTFIVGWIWLVLKLPEDLPATAS
jgi:hypothetical protein